LVVGLGERGDTVAQNWSSEFRERENVPIFALELDWQG
jgi:hypothetical protein